MEKPNNIKKSILDGNVTHLRQAGRKGGLIRAKQIKAEADQREYDRIRREEDERIILEGAKENEEWLRREGIITDDD